MVANRPLSHLAAGGRSRARGGSRASWSRYGAASLAIGLLLTSASGLPSVAAGETGVHPCTEAGLEEAVTAGGTQQLACASRTVITTSGSKSVGTDLVLAGGGKLVLDGGLSHRLFTVAPGVSLTLQGVTLQHGHADDGGAIRNAGTVVLVDSLVTGNVADRFGGAIFNELPQTAPEAGTVRLTGTSSISGNECGGDATGAAFPTSRLCGGGIWDATAFAQPALTAPVSGNTPDDCSALVTERLDLRAGIRGMCSWGTLLVPAGTHPVDDQLDLTRPITIQGATYENDAAALADSSSDSPALEHTTAELKAMMSVLQGDGTDRVLHVAASTTAFLQDLYVTGGTTTGDGGGILSDGSLVLENVVVANNSAAGDGGGVFASESSDVLKVSADGTRVAASLISGNKARCGGGLTSFTVANIVDTRIASNNATMCAAGAWLASNATLTRVWVDHNIMQGARRWAHKGGGLLVARCSSDDHAGDPRCGSVSRVVVWASDMQILANVAQCSDETSFPYEYPCRAYGGGLAVDGDSQVVGTRLTIASNRAHVIHRASGQTQALGGGVFVSPGASLELLDSLVGFNASTASFAWLTTADAPALITLAFEIALAVAMPELGGGAAGKVLTELASTVISGLADIGLTINADDISGTQLPATKGGGVYTHGELILAGTTRISSNSVRQQAVADHPSSLGAGLYQAEGSSVLLGRSPSSGWVGTIQDNMVGVLTARTCEGAVCVDPPTYMYCVGPTVEQCFPTSQVANDCTAEASTTWTAEVPPTYACTSHGVYRPIAGTDTITDTGNATVTLPVLANDLQTGVFAMTKPWRIDHGWRPATAYSFGDLVVPATIDGTCSLNTCRIYRVVSSTGSPSGANQPTWPTAEGQRVTDAAGVTYQDVTMSVGWYVPSVLLPSVPDVLSIAVVTIAREPRHGAASVVLLNSQAQVRYTPDAGYEGASDDFVYQVCIRDACSVATATVTFTDHPQPQEIHFTSTPPQAVYGGTYIVAATGGPSGAPVTFTPEASTASVCTVSGSTVHFVGTGWCVITANQAGNAQYSDAAPVQQWVGVQSALLTVAPSTPSGVVYGDPAPELHPEYSGFVAGDTPASVLSEAPTCSTSYHQGSAAGTHSTSCTAVLAANYAVRTLPGSLVVAGAPLVITAPSPAAVVYGDPVPRLLPTYSGFVLGESEQGNFREPPVCATDYALGSPVGSYETRCAGADAPNYDISYETGALVVGKATLRIVASSPDSIRYGDPAPETTPSYDVFQLGEGEAALSQLPTCATDYAPGSPPGTYATRCTGATASNYEIAVVEGTLVVDKAPLTIAALEPPAQYSDPMPELDYEISGFLFDDGPSALDGTITCAAPDVTVNQGGQVTSPAGSYPITCGGATSDRYNITWVDGWLTVASEDTVTRLSSGNPRAVPAMAPGGKATTPSMTFTVKVTEAADGSYGSISQVAPDLLAVVAVGQDVGVQGQCKVNQVKSSTGGQPGSASITCTVPAQTALGVHYVIFSLGGGSYNGMDQSALAIYDPAAPGTSGGATLTNPVTRLRADVAYTIQRSAKTGASIGQFLYLGRDAAGDVRTELWSSSFSELATSGNRATANGLARLWSPGSEAIDGNAIQVKAVDGRHDEIGLSLTDPSGARIDALTFDPITIGDGTIIVGR